MKLHGGDPFWPLQSGLLGTAPPLDRDASCDVVVVGAGITGALIAESLTRAGVEVIMLDSRDIVAGSTTASTALLQYELDVPLAVLTTMIGRDDAERAYRLGVEAIEYLEETGSAIGCPVTRRHGLYLARDDRAWEFLVNEADARRRAGLDVRTAEQSELSADWRVQARGALISAAAAEMDPYRYTHALLAAAQRRGARIFDRTAARAIEPETTGLLIRTERGPTIRCGRAVLACGYELHPFLPKSDVTLTSTYALVTEPVDPALLWRDRALLWEYADPYLYARTTPDHRIMVGGEDEPFTDPAVRDALIDAKTEAILAKLRTLIPGLPVEAAFSWAATFGHTEDGLGYIGTPTEDPRLLCAAGLGGNGINMGAIAARLIRNMVMGKSNDDLQLFRFDR